MATTTERHHPSDTARPRGRPPRRRLVLALGGLVGLLALGVVLVWFQPQALLFDRVVDDGFPTATSAAPDPQPSAGDEVEAPDAADGATDAVAPAADGAAASAAPSGDDAAATAAPSGDDAIADREPDEAAPAASDPVALGSGTFSSRNRYTVTGRATVYRLEDGSRTLRLEDFESTNGPDLFVYLTAADEADSDPQLDADVVDLGVLRGNVGNQNYDIPADVDLDRYDTVVIWCRRFSTGFGAADLITG
jgi:hypothetical protein